MHRGKLLRNPLAMVMGLMVVQPASAHADPLLATATPAQQFAEISALVGSWNVEGRDSLKIVFEATAGNSVIVEKWMRGEQLHSLTIYHLDGNKLLATHYCPQGNQPRMAAHPSPSDEIKFTFQDATDLDSTEGFQHDLSIALQDDGSIVRSEVYWGPDGAGEETAITLIRASD